MPVDAHAERGEAAPGTSTALIRLGGAIAKVDRYIDDKFRRRRSASHLKDNGRWNDAGAKAGRAAADAMPIGRKGVGAGSSASAKLLSAK